MTGTIRVRVPSLRSASTASPRLTVERSRRCGAPSMRAKPVPIDRPALDGPDDRPGHQVRVGELLLAPGGGQRLVERAPALVEHADVDRAEAGRGRDAEALVHVAREGRRRTLERDRALGLPGGGRGWAGAGAGAGPDSTAARTSRRRTCPPGPLPGRDSRSRPCSPGDAARQRGGVAAQRQVAGRGRGGLRGPRGRRRRPARRRGRRRRRSRRAAGRPGRCRRPARRSGPGSRRPAPGPRGPPCPWTPRPRSRPGRRRRPRPCATRSPWPR